MLNLSNEVIRVIIKLEKFSSSFLSIRFRRSGGGGGPEKPVRKKGEGNERRRRIGGLRSSEERIRDGNGLIGAPPEITCDDFDHEQNGGTVARVRFEEERPR